LQRWDFSVVAARFLEMTEIQRTTWVRVVRENHNFFPCQFVLDALDDKIQMFRLVDEIEIVRPNREDGTEIERPHPFFVECIQQRQRVRADPTLDSSAALAQPCADSFDQ
jgi:hypothetical protein